MFDDVHQIPDNFGIDPIIFRLYFPISDSISDSIVNCRLCLSDYVHHNSDYFEICPIMFRLYFPMSGEIPDYTVNCKLCVCSDFVHSISD